MKQKWTHCFYFLTFASICANFLPAASTFRVETSYAYSNRHPNRVNRRLIWTRADISRLQQQKQEKQGRGIEELSEDVRPQTTSGVTTFRQQFRPKIVFSPSAPPMIVEKKESRKIEDGGDDLEKKQQFRPNIVFSPSGPPKIAIKKNDEPRTKKSFVGKSGSAEGEEENLLLLVEKKPPEVVEARRAVLSRALKFADEVHGPVVSTRKIVDRNEGRDNVVVGENDDNVDVDVGKSRRNQARRLRTTTRALRTRGGEDVVDGFQELGKGGAYEFGYQVNSVQNLNEHYRHEKRLQDGTVIGSYGMRDTDGRVRIVDYVADARGFRATVRKSPNSAGPMTIQEFGNHVKRKKRSVVVRHKGEDTQFSPITSPAAFLIPPQPHGHHGEDEDHGNTINHDFEPTNRLTDFRDPLPTTENPAHHHPVPTSHGHGHGHVEPQIITVEDLQKLQTSNTQYRDEGNRVVKVTVGVLVPSEFQNYAPLFPPLEEGEDLQTLIPPPPQSLPVPVVSDTFLGVGLSQDAVLTSGEVGVDDEQLVHGWPPVPSSTLVPPPPPEPTPGEESRRNEVSFFPGVNELKKMLERRRRLLMLEGNRSRWRTKSSLGSAITKASPS